ncbi:MAG TPA: hypothetical protein VF120_13645 [Ktedonobacterales bacterium]
MAQVKIRPPSFSTPLPGATLYHPAGKLILLLVFVPFLLTVVAARVYASQGMPITYELPAVVAAWALLAPVFWRAIQTVRVSSSAIAAGRPWQAWREIEWIDVIRVERRGLRVHIVSRQGTRIRFSPLLLHDGAELRLDVLQNVSESVVQGALADEAVRVRLTARPAPGNKRTEPPGMLRVRPRFRLRLAAGLGVLTSLALGGLALAVLPIVVGVGLAVCALIGAWVCSVAFCWLAQLVILSDAGITVQAFPSGKTRGTLWTDVVVLEHTGSWSALRFTSTTGERVEAPGPGVVRPLDAQVYYVYFKQRLYDREHGVLVAQRHWLK